MDKHVAELETARAGFLADIEHARIDFAHDYRERFLAFCHTNNYAQRWPAESLRLAQVEDRRRLGLARDRVLDAIEAGWRPSPQCDESSAIQRLYTPDRAEQHAYSDLETVVMAAYDDVGRPNSKELRDAQAGALSRSHIAAFESARATVELQAARKSGNFRNLEDNHQTRKALLSAARSVLRRAGEPVTIADILNEMGLQNNEGNFRAAFDMLSFWSDKHAIEAKSIRSEGQPSAMMVLRVTAKGVDMLEGANTFTPPAINITNSGQFFAGGSFTNVNVSQSIGAELHGLIDALQALRNELIASDDSHAELVEPLVGKAIDAVLEPEPDRARLAKFLSGIGQLIQSVAALPQAWQFVVLEAAKIGVSLPPSPH